MTETTFLAYLAHTEEWSASGFEEKKMPSKIKINNDVYLSISTHFSAKSQHIINVFMVTVCPTLYKCKFDRFFFLRHFKSALPFHRKNGEKWKIAGLPVRSFPPPPLNDGVYLSYLHHTCEFFGFWPFSGFKKKKKAFYEDINIMTLCRLCARSSIQGELNWQNNAIRISFFPFPKVQFTSEIPDTAL